MRCARLLLAGAALSLVVSACSGDSPGEEPAPSVAPTDASSASSPSPTGPVEPTLPPEAEGDDAAAAEAFVRFYWEVANYAQARLDAGALDSWSSDGCISCDGAIKLLRRVARDGGEIRGGEASISGLETRALQAGDQRIFEVTFDVSNARQVVDFPGRGGDQVFKASTVRDRFRVTNHSGSWQVVSWDVLG